MKCVDLLTSHSRCRRGIPVTRLFRSYFCEGNHGKCPIRMNDDTKRRGVECGSRRLIAARSQG